MTDVPEELLQAAVEAMSGRISPEGVAHTPGNWWVDDMRAVLEAVLPFHEVRFGKPQTEWALIGDGGSVWPGSEAWCRQHAKDKATHRLATRTAYRSPWRLLDDGEGVA